MLWAHKSKYMYICDLLIAMSTKAPITMMSTWTKSVQITALRPPRHFIIS